MTSKRITPPSVMPVTLADARLALRVDGTDLDVIIQAWVQGITDLAEHLMRRSIMSQGWRLTLDTFPSAIRLTNPPLISVTAVTYLDESGTLQTLSPLDYVIDAGEQAAYIVPAYGKTWPKTYAQINAVIVDYVCGYGAAETSTPPAIRSYILAKLVEQFDPVNKNDVSSVQWSFIDSLLDRYIVWG